MGAKVMGVSLWCDSDGCVSMGAIVMHTANEPTPKNTAHTQSF